ncbi:MAG: TolC family protein [Bacteroidota bacterium]
MNIRGTVSIAIFLIANLSFSQSIEDYIEKGLQEHDISKKLPPLDSLISAAKENSPRLKFFDADYEYWSGTVTLAKKAWLNNINLDASYGYGVYDNLNNQQSGGNLGNQTLSTTEQSRYVVGASIKLPLSSIFNRNREIKNARAEAEKSKFQKASAELELEQLIVKKYNDLVKAHRLLYISGSIVETYKVQSIRAEKDFANGIINVAEYTRLQQMLNQAILSFESQRSEFLVAYMSLEGTVGIALKI